MGQHINQPTDRQRFMNNDYQGMLYRITDRQREYLEYVLRIHTMVVTSYPQITTLTTDPTKPPGGQGTCGVMWFKSVIEEVLRSEFYVEDERSFLNEIHITLFMMRRRLTSSRFQGDTL